MSPAPAGIFRRDVERFRTGLVFKAHRLVYRSTLGSRVIKKKKKRGCAGENLVDGLGDERSSLIRKCPPPTTTIGL